jgi:uncharacterized protein (DUF1684 family)
MIIAYVLLAWLIWIIGVPFIGMMLKSLGFLKKEKVSRIPERVVAGWGLLSFVAVLSFFILGSCTPKPDPAHIKEIQDYRVEMNSDYADSSSSPLTKEGLAHFNGLEFFDIDQKYRIEADFILNPDPEPFEMETTTSRRPIYVKYGEAHFKLDGKKYILEIYQSEKAKKMTEFKEHLFLPFKDLTNGNESYGGGRFLDLKIPAGETIIIDFNKAYNPYCAYNHRYSCPIPPEVNHLDIEISAGVKAYGDH